jgi:hypothetical protein
MGYSRAGFEVVGVDINPQPGYPFTFIQADALAFLRGDERLGNLWIERVDAIHASPPCQAYAASTAWRGRRSDHPRLIGPTRELLVATGLPFVIENVQDARAELRNPVRLCGSAFGLRVRRHRFFELSFSLPALVPPCAHRRDDYSFDHGGKQPESAYRAAMGVEWMTVEESREAIPPAYTEWLGRWLIAHLDERAA